jgi:PleD family two-component response regulator
MEAEHDHEERTGLTAGKCNVKSHPAWHGGESVMSTRIMVVHDEASLLGDLVNALRRAGYEVSSFSDTSAALAVVEADERVAMLITRVAFREGRPHGVSLALMARSEHRNIKILFLARPEMTGYTEDVGEVLVMPALAEDVVAKVREMLPLSD